MHSPTPTHTYTRNKAWRSRKSASSRSCRQIKSLSWRAPQPGQIAADSTKFDRLIYNLLSWGEFSLALWLFFSSTLLISHRGNISDMRAGPRRALFYTPFAIKSNCPFVSSQKLRLYDFAWIKLENLKTFDAPFITGSTIAVVYVHQILWKSFANILSIIVMIVWEDKKKAEGDNEYWCRGRLIETEIYTTQCRIKLLRGKKKRERERNFPNNLYSENFSSARNEWHSFKFW